MSNTEEKLIKSKDRINDFGEVFTPNWMVSEMLKAIPIDSFTNSDSIFFEPTCGNGQFIEGIFYKRLENDVDILIALNTLIATDIQEDNVYESRKRLYDLSVKYINQSNQSDKDKKLNIKRCVAIIINNIFIIDSLSYMRENKLKDHLFVMQPSKNYKSNFMDKNQRQLSLKKAGDLISSNYFKDAI